MSTLVIPNSVIIQGGLQVTGEKPAYTRTELTLESNAPHKIQPTDWRIWNAYATPLTATGNTDDLACVGGTFGTSAPSIQTGDLKNAGSTTRYARTTFQLPYSYVAGQPVTIRATSGMLTTVASVAATVDFEVYRSGDDNTVGSDLCATSAATINSTSFGPDDFTITPTTLLPGDTLDIRMAVLVNDSGTGTEVNGCVGAVEVLLGVKG